MKKNIPKHVALIMDGNRRWAKMHDMATIEGHRKGIDALIRTVEEANRIGIKYVTFYALSSENFQNRPKVEVRELLKLIGEGIRRHIPRLKKEGVRLNVFGNLEALPISTRFVIKQVLKQLAGGKGVVVNIAINYGGRDEIIKAAQNLQDKKLKITKKGFEKALYTAGIPDPDIIIRTGGQKRLSNFLIWQAAYSEFYFTDTLWPDFGMKGFQKALDGFNQKKRNFGR
ncbi:di-trans,poly-cis-decaprenylcistransferase [Patescibacteria group bacterium]|nr:di-trans,poly-cis-decaprenylcistransferase [Patescibacteria group bacterium]